MILITGGAGFVGRHLVRTLLQTSPTTLRILDVQPFEKDPGDRIESYHGSIDDADAVRKAVQGADIVVHLAAMVAPHASDWERMRRVNVSGARTVYAEAVAAGCRLFIHISSAGVYGMPRQGGPFRETDTPQPRTPYQQTKFEAEQELLRLKNEQTTLNVLRPAGIYGAGSLLELPTYRRIQHQRWAVELPGDEIVHPTHVTDVVGAIVALIGRPSEHGAILNVGGERPIALQAFHALIARTLHVSRRRIVLPVSLAWPLAAVLAPILARLGRRNPLLRDLSRGRILSVAVDDARFRDRYPDVPICPLETGLDEHISWARTQSLL